MRQPRAATQQEKPVRGEMLSVEKVADYIGCRKIWIHNRIVAGTLPFPHYPFEYGRRIDSADLDDYLRIRKVQPA